MLVCRLIPNFDGYGATEDGYIFSFPKEWITGNSIKRSHEGQFLAEYPCKGYLRVNLYRKGRMFKKFVHRLVAEAWIPNPKNKPQVNHLNGDKDDNRPVNLA